MVYMKVVLKVLWLVTHSAALKDGVMAGEKVAKKAF
jgi:hypothetical protein